jgi:hypothetical protein
MLSRVACLEPRLARPVITVTGVIVGPKGSMLLYPRIQNTKERAGEKEEGRNPSPLDREATNQSGTPSIGSKRVRCSFPEYKPHPKGPEPPIDEKPWSRAGELLQNS